MEKILVRTTSILFMVAAFLITGCEKPNTAPVAAFTFKPESGAMDTLFTFDASESYDDKDRSCDLEVRWDWESDGTWDKDYSLEKLASHRFEEFTDNMVTLEVKDSKGITSGLKKPVSISDQGTITGYDMRMCACCGGWFIRIGTDTLRFDQIPAGSESLLENPVYPLNVKVKWAIKNPRCMLDQILVFELSKR